MEENLRDEFYTLGEVAVKLKLSRKTVQGYINRKELKAFKIGIQLRIRREDLEDFIFKQIQKIK